MSGSKWKVEQNGQFLGHWCAKSAGEAVEKMLASLYAKVYNIDADDWFDVYKGSSRTQILMRPYEVYPEP